VTSTTIINECSAGSGKERGAAVIFRTDYGHAELTHGVAPRQESE
jgi:hypothetical protein